MILPGCKIYLLVTESKCRKYGVLCPNIETSYEEKVDQFDLYLIGFIETWCSSSSQEANRLHLVAVCCLIKFALAEDHQSSLQYYELNAMMYATVECNWWKGSVFLNG